MIVNLNQTEKKTLSQNSPESSSRQFDSTHITSENRRTLNFDRKTDTQIESFSESINTDTRTSSNRNCCELTRRTLLLASLSAPASSSSRTQTEGRLIVAFISAVCPHCARVFSNQYAAATQCAAHAQTWQHRHAITSEQSNVHNER